MNASTVIRLVAAREIKIKVTSKSYLLSTLGLVAVVVLGGVLINIFGSSDPLKVGLTPATSSLAASIDSLSSGDVELEQVSDEAAGRAQVEDGKLDALLTGTPEDLGVLVDTDLDTKLESTLNAVAQQQALAGQIDSLGGDPAEVSRAVADALPQVTELDPTEQDSAQVVASYVVGILIFMGLIGAGQLVAQGVVEEKTSRVVELLLATIKPWQLMAGKIIGIGVVGLGQLLAITVASVATATSLGLVDTSSLNVGATALGALGWFVLGYAAYATLLAGLAALVSRQEEVSSVISPVITLMVLPYVVGVSIGTWEPDNPLVVWMSRIPFSSPMVMPIRIAGGDAGALDVTLSVAVSVAVIPVLVWLAGRLYSNSVLQTGGRVSLLKALRAEKG